MRGGERESLLRGSHAHKSALTHAQTRFSCVSIVTGFAAPAWGGNAKLSASENYTNTHTHGSILIPCPATTERKNLSSSYHPATSPLSILSSSSPPHIFLSRPLTLSFSLSLLPLTLSLSVPLPPCPVSGKFIEVDNRGKYSLLLSVRRWLTALMCCKLQGFFVFSHGRQRSGLLSLLQVLLKQKQWCVYMCVCVRLSTVCPYEMCAVQSDVF